MQMEAQYRAAADASDNWRQRAEWALRKDDEDLAREALKRRKTCEVRVPVLAHAAADPTVITFPRMRLMSAERRARQCFE